MNVLIINGSPKAEKSETLKIAREFVNGMGAKAKEISTIKCDIKPCKGCYKCRVKGSGKCCIADDVHKILSKIKKSDVVIWSTPLFCYSVPSTLKALLDRMTSISQPTIVVNEKGETTHLVIDAFSAKHVLISGSPLPDKNSCFDSIKFQFRHMFGYDITMILCTENKLFSLGETKVAANVYLKAVRKAGADFVEYEHITRETEEMLDEQILPTDLYIESFNESAN